MPDTDYAQGMQASARGLAANAILAVIKLVAGLVGHSYALVADAVESMADIAGSVIIWGGLRIASRPEDHSHPYGHGKAEAIASLAVSLLLLAAAAGISIEAVHEIIVPHHAPAPFTLWVLLGVIVVKESMFRYVRRVARRTGSGAVEVDAWHHRTDAFTSLAAAVGIGVALIGGPGYEPADDWAALVASAVIAFNGVRLALAPLHELMDARPDALIAQVRTVAEAVPGVHHVEKLLARKSSLHYWVDMHIEVDPLMSVREAHVLTGKVKAAVREANPRVRSVLIHVEPHERRPPPPAP
jgi:cation diffusion facilitator family transporter